MHQCAAALKQVFAVTCLLVLFVVVFSVVELQEAKAAM